LENLSKSRTSKLWLFREVGSTPERLTIGRYEHRERPTTLVSHSLQRCHIDLINIRPLFPIYLDIYEESVHDRSHVIILETFVGHDMAPVASGIPYRQQNGSIQSLSLFQSSARPSAPVHRIILVL